MNLGKLEIVKNEMDRIGVDIMGISEMRWMGMGHFRSGETMIYYSGNDSNRKNGVAFLCSQKFSRFVIDTTQYLTGSSPSDCKAEPTT